MSSTTKSNSTTNSSASSTPTNPAWVTNSLTGLNNQINALGQAPPQSYVAGQTGLQQQANAQGAATLTGTNDNYTQAGSNYTGAAGLINGNASVDPNSISQWMNPYQTNVIDSTNALYDQNSAQQNAALEAQGAANGAFGGSRFGVAQGVLQGQQALGRGNIDANLLNTGYNTATQSAFQNAQLGQGAGGLLAGIGNDQTNLGTAENASNLANIGELSNLGAAQQQTNQAMATSPIALAQAMAALFGQNQMGLFQGQTGSGTTNTNATQTTNNPFGALTGLLGGLGSAASGVGSLVGAFSPAGA